MKTKISAFMLSIIMLLSLTACAVTPSSSGIENETTPPEETASPSPTPTFPTYPKESADITDLSEYTIVYPSYYDEYRMGEVFLLKDAIKNVTGAELDIISDGEEEREHEVIFASSKRQNGVEESISMFESGLDYVIGALNGNIILGGNNFYADMRAVYDFVNNYLGYNDIDNIYSEPEKTVDGINYHIYKEPDLIIKAANFGGRFTEIWQVRDVAEANFNMFHLDAFHVGYSETEIVDILKWCARFGLKAIIHTNFTRDSEGNYTGLYIKAADKYADNPAVYGHYLRDEPPLKDLSMYNNFAEMYKEQYGQYGWKLFLNHLFTDPIWNYLDEWDGLFSAVDTTGFDNYISYGAKRDDEVLHRWERAREYTLRTGQDYWIYVECVCLADRNASKMFRWQSYMSLCFGADALLYWNYSVPFGKLEEWDEWLVDDKFNRTDGWYDAQRTNAELLKLAPIYVQYENKGACVINQHKEELFTYLETPYDCSDVITDFIADGINKDTPYLIGSFDKKEGNGKAFIIMNINAIDDVPYDETESEPVRMKINGENVSFYFEGEKQNIQKDSDGYYSINMGNGYCWFVTVD